jgi:MATE family, multidrug efflux pump
MQDFKTHIKETLRLSYPVVIGQLGFMMMGVVDSLMVGRLGATSLAAASLANSLLILIIIIGLGSSMAVTPLIAIVVGAGKYNECGVFFRQSFLVNMSLSVIIFFIIYTSSFLIKFFNQPPDVVTYASSYLKILALTSFPVMLFQTYKQFIEGLSIMRPAMIVTLLANIINIFGNWVLIYGNLGAAALGLNGAGWSTFISRTFMAVVLMSYVMNKEFFKKFDVSFHFKNINLPVIKKIINVGLPSGFQYFFEVGAFSFAVIMVGWLGTKSLAAHQIAINLASISYMAVLGISVAGGIRVGNSVGRQNIKEVRGAGFSSILMGISVMLVSGTIFIFFRNFLPTLYINDKSVIGIASSLLIVAAIFQIFDGTQAVGIGILRGLTDVKIPTLITFISYWVIGLPAAYLFGFISGFGVVGVWIGLLLGLMASAILLTLRFNYKSKQRIAF